MAADRVEVILSAKDEFSRVFNQMENSSASLSSVLGKIGFVSVTTAAVAAATAVTKMVMATADAGDQFHELSQRTGISVEALSGLKYAAELSGSSIEGVATGLKFLGKNMAEATSGTGEVSAAFKSLGVNVKDTTGKLRPTNDVLLELSDKFRNMEDGSNKVAVAMKIFGRSATEIIPLLNEGSAGISKMTAEAERMGMTFTTEGAAAADEFNDNLTKMKGNITGITRMIGNDLIPIINKLFEVMSPPKNPLAELTKIEEAIRNLPKMGYSAAFVEERINALKKEREALFKELSHTGKGQFGEIEVVDIEAEEKRQKALDKLTSESNKLKEVAAKRLAEGLAAWEAKEAEKSMYRFAQATVVADESIMKERERAQQEFQRMAGPEVMVSGQSPEQIAEVQQMQDRLAAMQEFYTQKYVLMAIAQASEAEFMAVSREQEIAQSQQMWQMKLSGAQAAAGMMANLMQNLMIITGSKNRQMFETMKAFAIAEATISTYTSAVNAYKSASAIPLVGHILGPIAAAAAIAAGLANVKKISEAQPGGATASIEAGGTVSSGGYAGGAQSAYPEPQGKEPKIPQTVTIQVYSLDPSSVNWDRLTEQEIIPALNRGGDRNLQLQTNVVRA